MAMFSQLSPNITKIWQSFNRFHPAKKAIVIIFVCLFAGSGSYLLINSLAANSPAIYYISYTNGSDSNSGASTSSPWKLAPGMPGFCSGVSAPAAGTTNCTNYSHVAGDQYIFEGGDTWPNSALPLVPTGAGNASTQFLWG